jgi:hypothetical protein
VDLTDLVDEEFATPAEAAMFALNTPVHDLGTGYVGIARGGEVVETSSDGSTVTVPTPGVSGLLAGFSFAVEGATGSLVPALILAVVVAWLSVRSLDSAASRRKRRQDKHVPDEAA